ncbi:MAG: DUF4249 family protein [Rhodothermales bacterium]
MNTQPPNSKPRTPSACVAVALILALFGLARCDTVAPSEEAELVVEAFVTTGAPLPDVILRQTRPLSEELEGNGLPVTDAEVQIDLGDTRYEYKAVPNAPGRYTPVRRPIRVPEEVAFTLDVQWQAQHATGSGLTPPPIVLDKVEVNVPAVPQRAVLLDTLGVLPEEGFIYAVDVKLWWTSDLDEQGADSLYWIQAKLEPFTSFSSTVIDFFLQPESVLREREIPRDAQNRRSWRGVYAVAVDQETDPLPSHQLKVALLRSGSDYARFATSRSTPERREPISNVNGALGIVAGIAVDSLRCTVEHSSATTGSGKQGCPRTSEESGR